MPTPPASPAPLPPEEISELIRFRDMMARWLVRIGGLITDSGYAVQDQVAELVVQTPHGPRIEIQFRVLP